MAARTAISVQEYLRTINHPDCDYVDGEVVQRTLGEQSHGRLQGSILRWLWDRERLHGYRTLVEVRLQVSPTRFRIPDVMLIPLSAASERIIQTPSLLCIEVLSPEDTMKRTLARVGEYLNMGVPVCWVIDPEKRLAWSVNANGPVEATAGVLHAGDIEIPLDDVFEAL